MNTETSREEILEHYWEQLGVLDLEHRQQLLNDPLVLAKRLEDLMHSKKEERRLVLDMAQELSLSPEHLYKVLKILAGLGADDKEKSPDNKDFLMIDGFIPGGAFLHQMQRQALLALLDKGRPRAPSSWIVGIPQANMRQRIDMNAVDTLYARLLCVYNKSFSADSLDFNAIRGAFAEDLGQPPAELFWRIYRKSSLFRESVVAKVQGWPFVIAPEKIALLHDTLQTLDPVLCPDFCTRKELLAACFADEAIAKHFATIAPAESDTVDITIDIFHHQRRARDISSLREALSNEKVLQVLGEAIATLKEGEDLAQSVRETILEVKRTLEMEKGTTLSLDWLVPLLRFLEITGAKPKQPLLVESAGVTAVEEDKRTLLQKDNAYIQLARREGASNDLVDLAVLQHQESSPEMLSQIFLLLIIENMIKKGAMVPPSAILSVAGGGHELLRAQKMVAARLNGSNALQPEIWTHEYRRTQLKRSREEAMHSDLQVLAAGKEFLSPARQVESRFHFGAVVKEKNFDIITCFALQQFEELKEKEAMAVHHFLRDLQKHTRIGGYIALGQPGRSLDDVTLGLLLSHGWKEVRNDLGFDLSPEMTDQLRQALEESGELNPSYFLQALKRRMENMPGIILLQKERDTDAKKFEADLKAVQHMLMPVVHAKPVQTLARVIAKDAEAGGLMQDLLRVLARQIPDPQVSFRIIQSWKTYGWEDYTSLVEDVLQHWTTIKVPGAVLLQILEEAVAILPVFAIPLQFLFHEDKTVRDFMQDFVLRSEVAIDALLTLLWEAESQPNVMERMPLGLLLHANEEVREFMEIFVMAHADYFENTLLEPEELQSRVQEMLEQLRVEAAAQVEAPEELPQEVEEVIQPLDTVPVQQALLDILANNPLPPLGPIPEVQPTKEEQIAQWDETTENILRATPELGHAIAQLKALDAILSKDDPLRENKVNTIAHLLRIPLDTPYALFDFLRHMRQYPHLVKDRLYVHEIEHALCVKRLPFPIEAEEEIIVRMAMTYIGITIQKTIYGGLGDTGVRERVIEVYGMHNSREVHNMHDFGERFERLFGNYQYAEELAHAFMYGLMQSIWNQGPTNKEKIHALFEKAHTSPLLLREALQLMLKIDTDELLRTVLDFTEKHDKELSPEAYALFDEAVFHISIRILKDDKVSPLTLAAFYIPEDLTIYPLVRSLYAQLATKIDSMADVVTIYLQIVQEHKLHLGAERIEQIKKIFLTAKRKMSQVPFMEGSGERLLALDFLLLAHPYQPKELAAAIEQTPPTGFFQKYFGDTAPEKFRQLVEALMQKLKTIQAEEYVKDPLNSPRARLTIFYALYTELGRDMLKNRAVIQRRSPENKARHDGKYWSWFVHKLPEAQEDLWLIYMLDLFSTDPALAKAIPVLRDTVIEKAKTYFASCEDEAKELELLEVMHHFLSGDEYIAILREQLLRYDFETMCQLLRNTPINRATKDFAKDLVGTLPTSSQALMWAFEKIASTSASWQPPFTMPENLLNKSLAERALAGSEALLHLLDKLPHVQHALYNHVVHLDQVPSYELHEGYFPYVIRLAEACGGGKELVEFLKAFTVQNAYRLLSEEGRKPLSDLIPQCKKVSKRDMHKVYDKLAQTTLGTSRQNTSEREKASIGELAKEVADAAAVIRDIAENPQQYFGSVEKHRPLTANKPNNVMVVALQHYFDAFVETNGNLPAQKLQDLLQPFKDTNTGEKIGFDFGTLYCDTWLRRLDSIRVLEKQSAEEYPAIQKFLQEFEDFMFERLKKYAADFETNVRMGKTQPELRLFPYALTNTQGGEKAAARFVQSTRTPQKGYEYIYHILKNAYEDTPELRHNPVSTFKILSNLPKELQETRLVKEFDSEALQARLAAHKRILHNCKDAYGSGAPEKFSVALSKLLLPISTIEVLTQRDLVPKKTLLQRMVPSQKRSELYLLKESIVILASVSDKVHKFLAVFFTACLREYIADASQPLELVTFCKELEDLSQCLPGAESLRLLLQAFQAFRDARTVEAGKEAALLVKQTLSEILTSGYASAISADVMNEVMFVAKLFAR